MVLSHGQNLINTGVCGAIILVALDEYFHHKGTNTRSRRRKDGFGCYRISPTASASSVNSVACDYYLMRDLLYRAVALTNTSGHPSALSHLQIRIDWPQRLQMQEAAAKIGSVDPLSCCAAADGAFAANPVGRGPGGRELWRSSSRYAPIHFPSRFEPTAPWPSVNPNL